MPALPPVPSSQKPLESAGAARKDLLAFPDVARRNVGFALGLAQLGGKHPDAKHWQGEGPRVFDIDLIRHRLRAAAQHYEAHYGKEDGNEDGKEDRF